MMDNDDDVIECTPPLEETPKPIHCSRTRKRPTTNNLATKSKKQRSGAPLRRSLTDSDIEICEMAARMSPAIRDGLAETQGTAGNCRTTQIDRTNSCGAQVVSPYIGKATINDLPTEILEEIFSILPAIDLFQFCGVVCKRFHGIVSDENYLPWKKLYARYLRRQDDAVFKVEGRICNEIAGNDRGLGLMKLISYMSGIQRLTEHETEEALCRLARHPLYAAAVDVVKNAMRPKSPKDAGENFQPNLSALVAAFVLISEDVASISRIVHLLTAQPAFCKRIYWIEYFYCLLTLLQAYTHREVLKDGRLHYQLKYAVYLLENDGKTSFRDLTNKVASQRQASGSSGVHQTSMGQYVQRERKQPTYEQCRIIGYDLKPGDFVRIVAFAGTGKTTTLLEYCLARPHKRFLVVFYNKDIAEDAKKRFPFNATCRTIHSLAFRVVGHKYQNQTDYGSIKLNIILDNTSEIKGLDRYVRAALIRQTLVNFFASVRGDISSENVPDTWETSEKNGESKTIFLEEFKCEIVKQASAFWEIMKDVTNKRIWITPDGYLKKPKFWGGYHALLIDEAQDCNPAALDIFNNQSMPKILVGDGYQQIYGFRGAINALDIVPATKTFYLTQSFRFGPEIAYVANCWMRTLLQEQNKFLIGTNKPSRLDGVIEGQLAIICRTNFTVFDESVGIAKREGRPCLCIGTAEKPFDFHTLEVLYYLYLSENSRDYVSYFKPDHWLTKRFRSFQEVKNFAEMAKDWELLSKVKIVDKYGIHTTQMIQLIKNCCVSDRKMADFVVTTAHKSKGLEFKNVRLAGDFPDFDDPRVQWDADELKLLYVAMTRAMNSLVLNGVVWRALTKRLGPLFHSPHFPTINEILPCSACGKTPPIDLPKFLRRKTLAISSACGLIFSLHRVQMCKHCVASALEKTEEDERSDFGIIAPKILKDKCYKFFLPCLE